MIGITAYGAYLPRTRLSRKAILKATGWLNPALMGNSQGTRSVANWDEDTVTMAVAAARNCLTPTTTSSVGSVYFASPAAPFKFRLNSSIVASALGLREACEAVDIGSSRRSGLSAMVQASHNVNAEPAETALVVASDMPPFRAGTTGELTAGDAAAAVLFGSENVLAELVAHHCETIDFIDAFQGSANEFGSQWEERWIRDEGHFKLVPKAIHGLLSKANVKPEQIDKLICPLPGRGSTARVCKMTGISAEAIADDLFISCGDTRTAHPLVQLCHILETAKPGQLILVVAFGQGTELLLLKTTENCQSFIPQQSVADQLSSGVEEQNYFKYLVFRDRVDWDKESRGPVDSPTKLSSTYRDRHFLNNLQGLHCPETRQVFFGSEAEYKASLTDSKFVRKSFANSKARIISWSANYLGVSMDPAICTGIIEFDEGGRLILDLTEADPQGLSVGTAVEMTFRIHGVDESQGFTRYFWKAKPVMPAVAVTGGEQS